MGKEERADMLVEVDEVTRELTETLLRTQIISKELGELEDFLREVLLGEAPKAEAFPNLKNLVKVKDILEIAAKARKLHSRKSDLEKRLGLTVTKRE